MSRAFHGLVSRGAVVPPDFLERRAARSERPVVVRRDGVQIVGAHRQRDLCELRSVQRPVDLNRRHGVGDDARERDALEVVVAGRRRRGIDATRERRERADDRDRALELGDRLDERQRID